MIATDVREAESTEGRKAAHELASKMGLHLDGQETGIAIAAVSNLISMFAVTLLGGDLSNPEAASHNIRLLAMSADYKAQSYIQAMEAKSKGLN